MFEEISLHGRGKFALQLIKNCEYPILDAGCAWGYVTRHIPKKELVTGLDVKREEVKYAKLHDRSEYVIGSVMESPFKDNSFATVLLLDVLEHVESDKKTIEQIKRILEPKGKLILSVPYDTWLSRTFDPGYKKGHRHYSLNKLRELTKNFDMKIIHRGGFFLNSIASYIYTLADVIDKYTNKTNKIRKFLRKYYDYIADTEYQIDFKGHGITIMLLLEKKE